MAQLIVRNLEDELVQELKERAGRHGRSAEAEHREILREALCRKPAKDFKSHLLEMPEVGRDSDFQAPRDKPRQIDL